MTQAKFEGNLLRLVRARADMRALMTRKSCAVGMRNVILGIFFASLRGKFCSPVVRSFLDRPSEYGPNERDRVRWQIV